jgi:tetratricopeptide (TPR) repeat protein
MTRIRITLAAFSLFLVAALACAAPKTDYPFTVAPDQAFATLAKLERTSGVKTSLTADEKILFADAGDGKLDDWSMGEACLMASGVTEPAQRQKYLARLDEIEKKARKAIEGARTAPEKGAMLLKFLHDGPMAKGYESRQTDLHTLIDHGTFNCVSSAVLYHVIGQRLGLELCAVEVPQHVFVVLIDGDQRLDVETTSAQGFNPHGDAKEREKIRKAAGNRREIGPAGLAAVVAYNHGVGLASEKHFAKAVAANFRALALDRTNPSAIKNALAELTNWPLELAKKGEYEEALTVIAVALELAPKERGLLNNHKVLWCEYAEARYQVGKTAEALEVLRRAASAIPSENMEARQAYLFIEPAQKLMDAGKWEEALTLFSSGITQVDTKARKPLEDARAGLFLNWSKREVKEGRFEKALEILRRGAGLAPKDGRFRNNMLVAYDAWAGTHMKRGEWDQAIEVYEKGLKELPGDRHLANNLAYCKQEAKR